MCKVLYEIDCIGAGIDNMLMTQKIFAVDKVDKNHKKQSQYNLPPLN